VQIQGKGEKNKIKKTREITRESQLNPELIPTPPTPFSEPQQPSRMVESPLLTTTKIRTGEGEKLNNSNSNPKLCNSTL